MSGRRCKLILCLGRAQAAARSIEAVADDLEDNEEMEELAQLADRFAERSTKIAIRNAKDPNT